MQIDMTEIANKIRYNARTGAQGMKVIEVTEKLDDARQEFLSITFVNQYGELHIEKFYPDRHAEKLYELALAIGDDCFFMDADGRTIVNTKSLVGGYFHCVLTNVPMKNGEITDNVYIRDIRAHPWRKDTTGARTFKKTRRRKK